MWQRILQQTWKILIWGFVVVHTAGALCSQSTSLSSGYVRSPNSNNVALISSSSSIPTGYPNNKDCTYDIRASLGSIIKLTWKYFDIDGYMPTCWPKDYVEIFIGCTGSRKSIGKYCSTNSYKPFDVYSPDSCLRIKFHSDGSDTKKGFLGYFQSYPNSQKILPGNPRRSMSSTSGTIGSPQWPYPYRATGSSYYYQINVGNSKNIKMAFMDFNMERDIGCDDTKLKIKGGSNYATYSSARKVIKDSSCGSKYPFYFTSTEEVIFIRFKTSYRNTGYRGFVAGYVLYEPSIHDTGTKMTAIVVGIIVAIAFFGCIAFICIRKRRAARNRPPPHVVEAQRVPLAPPPQSYPMQSMSGPSGGQMQPPPSYGQAMGVQYPPPPPGPLPPTGEYPPPGPYPGGPPHYPPQGGGYYPPPQPGGQPYPPSQASAPPYPPQAGQPYPAPGQAPPYPPS